MFFKSVNCNMFGLFFKIIVYFIVIDIRIAICFEMASQPEKTISCAVKIANNNYNYRKPTVILNQDVDDRLTTEFLKAYKGTVIIDTKENGAAKQVVIILENHQSFTKLLNKLKPDIKGKNLFNGAAKFLIIMNASRKKLDHITRFLWGYYVTDIVIMTKEKKNRNALYTYFPYRNHLNCQNTSPVFIGYCNNSTSYKNIYPDKMRNMHECPLYISTNKIYNPGAEGKIALQQIKRAIIRLLRDILNFTPIISTRDYVSFDSDRAKNWSDSLNDVISGIANISTCSIPLGVDRLGLLDYSMPYFRVRIAWLGPPVISGPVWWRLLSPLNSYLWLVLLVVTFLVISLPFVFKFKRVKKFGRRHFKNFDKIQGAAFKIWGALLGQTVRVAPRRFRDFYIVGLWIWFTFVVRNAYQSVLIGALKTDTLVGNFANLKETVNNGYKFGGRAGIYVHFEFDPLIKDEFEIIPELKFEDVFRDVIDGKRNFVLATSLEYAFGYCLAQGKKENECGHVLPDSILTLPLVVWMKMYSPIVRPLSLWLPRMIESGLLEKDAILKTNYVASITSDPSALTIHQMLSCFLCLLLGSLISIIVFLFEIFRKKTSKYTIIKKSTLEALKLDGNKRF